MRRRALVLAALVMAAGQGCYTYRPLPSSAAPRLSERVRIELTPQGTTELARYLGPNVTVAEGHVSSVAADGAMVVAVDFVQQANGTKQPWSGEGVVSFPSMYRSAVHERKFLRKQTIIASAALGAGLVSTAIVALKQGGAGGDGTGPGTPPPP